MLAFVIAVALLAYSSAVITGNDGPTEAAAPMPQIEWEAITAGLEYSGDQEAASAAEDVARRRNTVVARPLPPRDGTGQTVMLDPLPPSSIIGKGAGLILEKPPAGLTVTGLRR